MSEHCYHLISDGQSRTRIKYTAMILATHGAMDHLALPISNVDQTPPMVPLAQLAQESKLSTDHLKSWRFPNSSTTAESHSTLAERSTNLNTPKASTATFGVTSELSDQYLHAILPVEGLEKFGYSQNAKHRT